MNSTSTDLNWPLCCCGHIAQAHNQKLGQEPHNYGCDHNDCGCRGYSFPAKTPVEYRRALELQRQRILDQLDARETNMSYDKRLEIKPHIYRYKGRWCVAYKPICNLQLVRSAIWYSDYRNTSTCTQ